MQHVIACFGCDQFHMCSVDLSTTWIIAEVGIVPLVQIRKSVRNQKVKKSKKKKTGESRLR